MLTFLYNLCSVLKNVPAAITIIKAIMDIVGSESVKTVLKAVQDAVQQLKPTDTPIESLPPQERKRFRERVQQRINKMTVAMYAAADAEKTAEFTA